MKALIVDDEQFCRDNLKLMIKEYCPAILQTETAADADEARNHVANLKPDVLFLDVQMPRENGLELLNSLGNHEMSVIFTTAHREYALDALKSQAVDYLEKPINIDDLQTAVGKVESKGSNSLDKIRELINSSANSSSQERIAIPMREGYEIISYDEIIHLEASESYTMIYLDGEKKILSSKNIKVYEDKLSPLIFFRTHKSHIINMRDHLKGFNRIDGNSAVMSNGKYVPIARRKLQSFLDRISGM